nr:reverse transcriptase domain-containing protein [Tanacetum cinerariifolium]
MAQMLQAPIEGYEDAIVVPPINANNFELKQTLINLVQSNQFMEGEAQTWLDKEPPRSILMWEDLVSKFINQFFPPSKTTYLRNEIINFLQKPNETFNEACERFKDLLRQCPHHSFSELHQLDTFYNALNPSDQDTLDSVAGEPSSTEKALEDPDWVAVMQEEMQQFFNQQVWKLVPLPDGKIAIGTKWILKNKRDAREEVPLTKHYLLRRILGILFLFRFMWMTSSLVPRIKPGVMSLSQDKYIKDMLKKFDMESVRTATTPYEVPKPKSKDEPNDAINVHLYRSIIGSLMYLTASRPDIMFALEAYSDSDYAGSHGDRKSTTGGCQFLCRRLISWQCKKQTIMATFSTKAKYVATASYCGQASNAAGSIGDPAG